MKNYVVNGGRPLFGTVTVSGSKNAALPLLFGALATGSVCELYRMPYIGDVRGACEILRQAGAEVEWQRDESDECDNTVTVRAPHAIRRDITCEVARKMRGSYYLLGAALARGGCVCLPLPGGCALGTRPIDLHLAVFAALGAKVSQGDGYVEADGRGGLKGTDFAFVTPSVGATVNAVLAALGAAGTTTLRGVSVEPHVCDFLRFLRSCGAVIEGIGSDRIAVEGGHALHGCRFAPGADMAEAGTYLIAGVLTGGSVTARGITGDVLAPLLSVLRKIGADVMEDADRVTATDTGVRRGVLVDTGPFPSFPTDLHPQLAVLLTSARGPSMIREHVWPERFRYAEMLGRSGLSCSVRVPEIVLYGAGAPRPAVLGAPDLRAGAASLLCALASPGLSVIEEVETIERGYERLPRKLRALGARICERA